MNKLNKEQLDVAIEIGMVTALMSCEGRVEKLYQKINEEIGCGGICDTVYTLTWFATEFIDIHKDTDWEELEGDISLYRSNKYKQFGKQFSSWDEAAEDYAEWRIENFNFEEFEKINHNINAKNPLLSEL